MTKWLSFGQIDVLQRSSCVTTFPICMHCLCQRGLADEFVGRLKKGGTLNFVLQQALSDWELVVVETFSSTLQGKAIRREDIDKEIWKKVKKKDCFKSNLPMWPRKWEQWSIFQQTLSTTGGSHLK